MKDLIVSFATKGREDYCRSLLRLIDSCKQHWPGDLLIYSPDHELWMYRDTPIIHSKSSALLISLNRIILANTERTGQQGQGGRLMV